MTIHSDHPFLPPEEDRNQVRRLRGRIASGVTVWATGSGRERAGLTVSSLLVADGEPAHVLGLVDPDADFCDAVGEHRTFAVNVLAWPERALADAFAGVAPAPGGPFRTGDWVDTAWGPVLGSGLAWAGCRLVDAEPRPVGWSVLLDAIVERVELPEEPAEALVHRRGRYHRLGD